MGTIEPSLYPEGTEVKVGRRNATVVCQILEGDTWGDVYITYDSDQTFAIVKPTQVTLRD
jgi:hypothetical protein